MKAAKKPSNSEVGCLSPTQAKRDLHPWQRSFFLQQNTPLVFSTQSYICHCSILLAGEWNCWKRKPLSWFQFEEIPGKKPITLEQRELWFFQLHTSHFSLAMLQAQTLWHAWGITVLQGGKKSNGSSDYTGGLNRQRMVTEVFLSGLMSWLLGESLAAL